MGLTYNGEGVTIADSAELRANTAPYWEVRGKDSAELRLTEQDQEDPAGRYRIRVEDDTLLFQRASESASAGITDAAQRVPWKTFVTIDSGGVTIDPLNEDQSQYLQVLLMYVQEVREMVQAALESGEDHGE